MCSSDLEWSENEWENSETEDPLLGNCGCPNVSNDLRGVAIPSHLPSDGISEVWELSSRHLPDRFRAINSQAPGLTAQRHTASGWIRDDLENALIDDGRLTIVYVHGNFMERNNSLNRVLIIDDYLRRRTNRPYRILMLSWPSTREPHPLRDVFEIGRAHV